MMKKQNKKRGFTIVELTIVVSVIAILSAVLIPTFAGVIKNSKLSADKAAVRSLNTIIAEYDEDFDDSDFEKAEKVNSNTQLYKQAGNSIVVDVIQSILNKLIVERSNSYGK